jgi:hypothetical protein
MHDILTLGLNALLSANAHMHATQARRPRGDAHRLVSCLGRPLSGGLHRLHRARSAASDAESALQLRAPAGARLRHQQQQLPSPAPSLAPSSHADALPPYSGPMVTSDDNLKVGFASLG